MKRVMVIVVIMALALLGVTMTVQAQAEAAAMPQLAGQASPDAGAVVTDTNAVSGTVSLVTDTNGVSGTVQITADSPEAINELFQNETAVPGGYDNYTMPIVLSLFFGALGGIVFELLRLRGSLEMPHRYDPTGEETDVTYLEDAFANKNSLYDLGVFARIFIGSMAALSILLVITPPDPMKLIAAAIIAGSASASIFDAMRTRLTATLAVADATDVRDKSIQLQERLDKMDGIIQQLNDQMRVSGVQGHGAEERFMEGDEGQSEVIPQFGPSVDPKLVEQLSSTLGEAKGIRAAMQRGSH